MKCKKCGFTSSCSCSLSDKIGVHFPCDGCNFNQPLFEDPCCMYPDENGAFACPFVTDEDRSILARYARYNSVKDDIALQLISAMREFDSGNAKKEGMPR